MVTIQVWILLLLSAVTAAMLSIVVSAEMKLKRVMARLTAQERVDREQLEMLRDWETEN